MKNFDTEYDLRVLRVDSEGQPVKDARGDYQFDTVKVSRNGRVDRDRTFVVGGQTFTYRPSVAPESIKRWSQMSGGEFTLKDDDGRPILDAEGQPQSTLTEDEALSIFDSTVLAFLEEGQEDKWKTVRDPNAAIPLNLTDLQALIRWLFEEQSGRPTTPPSGSTNGSGNGGTGTSSTVASSSQAETV